MESISTGKRGMITTKNTNVFLKQQGKMYKPFPYEIGKNKRFGKYLVLQQILPRMYALLAGEYQRVSFGEDN